MIKTLIAIPCFDMVHTDFMESFIKLQKPEGTSFTIVKDTLINEARNIIAANAIKGGFDRVMWFDSDMKFAPDTLIKLSAQMDKGYDYISGLYFTRRPPIKPVLFKGLWWDKKDGKLDSGAEHYFDYPDGKLIECAGTGFGCVLTSVDLLNLVGKRFGSPFAPLDSMGEDLSFCWRVIQCGIKMFCDTSVKCGHVGMYEYNEPAYTIMGAKRDE